MALVNTETGEIVDAMTRDEAVALTVCIRDHAEQMWGMLVEAHDRRAWSALGYTTWADYVQAEFDMSRSRSYQLLDRGRVIRAIEEVTGVSTSVDITEAVARDIKPHLKAVTDSIKEKVTAEATVEPERVKEIVAEVVAEERTKAKQQAEDRAAIAALNEQAKDAGIETDRSVLAERGAFTRLCGDITKQADPADFVARHRDWFNDRRIAMAENAYAWLDAFLLEAREGK